jgi:hypothetical protein
MINCAGTPGGAGTQNEAVGFGGRSCATFGPSTCTELYNGTSWSTGNPLITARYALGAAGTQAAGLAFGGQNNPVGSVALSCTEEFTAQTGGVGVCSL